MKHQRTVVRDTTQEVVGNLVGRKTWRERRGSNLVGKVFANC
jgi:hypothetical protein